VGGSDFFSCLVAASARCILHLCKIYSESRPERSNKWLRVLVAAIRAQTLFVPDAGYTIEVVEFV
jgi:hypothetical protein